MSEQRNNQIKRCERRDCRRATFVETEEGVSADFYHGGRSHREVYTEEMMKVYLAKKGYVVIKAGELVKAA